MFSRGCAGESDTDAWEWWKLVQKGEETGAVRGLWELRVAWAGPRCFRDSGYQLEEEGRPAAVFEGQCCSDVLRRGVCRESRTHQEVGRSESSAKGSHTHHV